MSARIYFSKLKEISTSFGCHSGAIAQGLGQWTHDEGLMNKVSSNFTVSVVTRVTDWH